MVTYETNCIVLPPSRESSDLIFEIFGDEFWNDTENIFCAPVKEINEVQIEKLKKAGIVNIEKAQFLICDHDCEDANIGGIVYL